VRRRGGGSFIFYRITVMASMLALKDFKIVNIYNRAASLRSE
jgi:hypothetical protein